MPNLRLIGMIAGAVLILGFLASYAMKARALSKCQDRVIALSAELKRISDEKDRQAETTRRTIQQARKQAAEAKKVKERIMSAPNPEDCGTPGLDAAREVL